MHTWKNRIKLYGYRVVAYLRSIGNVCGRVYTIGAEGSQPSGWPIYSANATHTMTKRGGIRPLDHINAKSMSVSWSTQLNRSSCSQWSKAVAVAAQYSALDAPKRQWCHAPTGRECARPARSCTTSGRRAEPCTSTPMKSHMPSSYTRSPRKCFALPRQRNVRLRIKNRTSVRSDGTNEIDTTRNGNENRGW